MPLLAILNKSNAFNKTSYPNMRLLALVHDLNEANRVDHPKFISYASRVAQSQVALELHAINYINDFVGGILQGPPIQTIQYLSFDRAKFSLDSLCALVSLLPQLSQLSFGYFFLGEPYSELSATGLHDHITSKWRTLSENLQYCHISCYEAGGVDDMAMCGMLMSILCPRFTRLVVHGQLYDLFSRSIECALEEEPFAKYAERLRRLAFSTALDIK
ncbi:hypothetical protein IWW47_005358 [Coemansia sp. RSA 2052]|nr:hypothetical protein IWW47_005358 [Coemansia sp. RSA 2052]